MNKNVYRITYDIAKNIQTIAQHCLKGNANFYSNVIFGFFFNRVRKKFYFASDIPPSIHDWTVYEQNYVIENDFSIEIWKSDCKTNKISID